MLDMLCGVHKRVCARETSGICLHETIELARCGKLQLLASSKNEIKLWTMQVNNDFRCMRIRKKRGGEVNRSCKQWLAVEFGDEPNINVGCTLLYSARSEIRIMGKPGI